MDCIAYSKEPPGAGNQILVFVSLSIFAYEKNIISGAGHESKPPRTTQATGHEQKQKKNSPGAGKTKPPGAGAATLPSASKADFLRVEENIAWPT